MQNRLGLLGNPQAVRDYVQGAWRQLCRPWCPIQLPRGLALGGTHTGPRRCTVVLTMRARHLPITRPSLARRRPTMGDLETRVRACITPPACIRRHAICRPNEAGKGEWSGMLLKLSQKLDLATVNSTDALSLPAQMAPSPDQVS